MYSSSFPAEEEEEEQTEEVPEQDEIEMVANVLEAQASAAAAAAAAVAADAAGMGATSNGGAVKGRKRLAGRFSSEAELEEGGGSAAGEAPVMDLGGRPGFKVS